MKVLLILIGCLAAHITVFSQNVIPEKISVDLVLKPQAKPYESMGFDVEKGATLTILPGTKINMSAKPGDKNAFPVINVYGKIIIGTKGAENSKPVIIECKNSDHGPWLLFNDATIEITPISCT